MGDIADRLRERDRIDDSFPYARVRLALYERQGVAVEFVWRQTAQGERRGSFGVVRGESSIWGCDYEIVRLTFLAIIEQHSKDCDAASAGAP